MSEELTVKVTTTPESAADTERVSKISTVAPPTVDTEEIERSSHIDDGVSGLRLRPRGKLDDLLGGLEELRHSRPRATGPRTLEHKK